MDVYEVRLANLRALQGEMTRRELAARLSMEPGQLNHFFMQRTTEGYRNIGTKVARRIEDAFDKPRGWLDRPQGLEVAEPVPAYTRDVPIVGNVIATPDTDGYFEDMGFPPGVGEGYVPWATRDRRAYAVRVKGDSMYPRYRPGEILVVEPNAAVAPGEDVIVKTKSGRKMVKRLLFQRAGELELGSINEGYNPLTIALDDIESIEVIVGSVRRGGER